MLQEFPATPERLGSLCHGKGEEKELARNLPGLALLLTWRDSSLAVWLPRHLLACVSALCSDSMLTFLHFFPLFAISPRAFPAPVVGSQLPVALLCCVSCPYSLFLQSSFALWSLPGCSQHGQGWSSPSTE